MNEKWQIVTCAPMILGEQEPERPYIKHHDIELLKFHLVTTYKSMNPPTCLCGDPIPEEIIRQFNFKTTGYKVEPLPLPEKSGIIV